MLLLQTCQCAKAAEPAQAEKVGKYLNHVDGPRNFDDTQAVEKTKPMAPEKADATKLEGYDDAVKMQMKMLQSIAQRYARHHEGKYPVALDEGFKNCFPQITINHSKSTSPFYNPFTKKQEWFEVKPLEKIDKADDIQAAAKGQIFYCPLSNGSNFAIVAGAHDGKLLRDKSGKIIILTKK